MSAIVLFVLAALAEIAFEVAKIINQKRKLFAMQLRFQHKRHTSQRRMI